MAEPTPAPASASSIGGLLQYWRKTRNLSQLALANEAEVSPRHLCFLETGRARPSREMVVLLARTLDVPLRERNALLLAAGFAPLYGESRLDAPELAAVRHALAAILRQQEPFPAVVLDRHWNIVDANAAARRFFGFLLGPEVRPEPANVLRLMFDPGGLRPHVQNWRDAASALLQRVHREAVSGVKDERTERLLEELLGYPGVPEELRTVDLGTPLLPIVPIRFRKDGLAFDYFSAVTTLGTPQDVTVQEVRIECFFPENAETEERARRMAEGHD